MPRTERPTVVETNRNWDSMTLQIRLTGKYIGVKRAKQSIEFIREMAVLQMLDVRDIAETGYLEYLDKGHRQMTFRPDSDLTEYNAQILHEGDNAIRTKSFGIEVNFPNDSYLTVQFAHMINNKCVFAFGSAYFDLVWYAEDTPSKRQAVNNHLWSIHTLETIKSNFMPELEIRDESNYHKTPPDAETLAYWRQEKLEGHGVDREADFENLQNHNLEHLLSQIDFDIASLTARRMHRSDVLTSKRIAKMRMWLNHTPEVEEYSYITQTKKDIRRVLSLFGIRPEEQAVR